MGDYMRITLRPLLKSFCQQIFLSLGLSRNSDCSSQMATDHGIILSTVISITDSNRGRIKDVHGSTKGIGIILSCRFLEPKEGDPRQPLA